jgi:hypothetical protein
MLKNTPVLSPDEERDRAALILRLRLLLPVGGCTQGEDCTCWCCDVTRVVARAEAHGQARAYSQVAAIARARAAGAKEDKMRGRKAFMEGSQHALESLADLCDRRKREQLGDGPPTGRVDINQPDANMYGCLACPKCRGDHRYVAGHRERDGAVANVGEIICTECDFREPVTEYVG